MTRFSPLCRWTRAVLAAAMVWGMAALPTGLPTAPAWLVSAICHAPVEDGSPAHDPAGAPGHVHCALCQAAPLACDVPQAVPLPLPRVVFVRAVVPVFLLWPGPGPDRPYASRAPPGIG